MSKLRLGIIGAGSVAELHVNAARTLPGRIDVVAVADPQPRAAEALALQVGARTFPDHTSLAESGLVDAVVVASPDGVHCEQVLDLAARGLHILVEKPMALTSDDCAAMIDAAQRAGVVLAVGHLQRYLPPVATSRRLLREGVIGELRMVNDRRSGRYEEGTRPAWFLDPSIGHGGILTNLGSHCVDKLFYLTNRRLRSVRTAWSSGDGVATDVAAFLDLERGLPAALVMTGTGLPDADTTEVIGTKGALRLSRGNGVEVFARGQVVHHEPSRSDDVMTAFTAQLSDFHRAATTQTPPGVDGGAGRDIVRALERIAEAADIKIADSFRKDFTCATTIEN